MDPYFFEPALRMVIPSDLHQSGLAAEIKVTLTFILSEETSHHAIQVLRMKEGSSLLLTDGSGHAAQATLQKAHKKKAEVILTTLRYTPAPKRKEMIGIALLKNSGRMEWFLEKATELGINAIFPLLTSRTEKQHFREDRMRGILVAAMLQSQKVWLPDLHEPVQFSSWIQHRMENRLTLVAHCMEDHLFLPQRKTPLLQELSQHRSENYTERLLLIGPEGDFTANEVEQALSAGALPVSLGSERLRTETAALYGAVLLVQSL